MKWLIVAILFGNGVPTDYRIFALHPDVKTREDCMAEVAKMKDVADKRGADVFIECVEVKHETPKFKKENDS